MRRTRASGAQVALAPTSGVAVVSAVSLFVLAATLVVTLWLSWASWRFSQAAAVVAPIGLGLVALAVIWAGSAAAEDAH